MRTTTRPLLIVGLLSASLFGGITAMAQTSSTSESTTSSKARTFSGEIAKADLAATGVSEPTDQQLSTRTSEVQAMRDSGMGWGAIANALGLRLGEVVSAANRAEKATEKQTERAERTSLAKKSRSDDGSDSRQSGKSGEGHGSGKGSGKGGGGGGKGGGGGGGGGGGKR